MRKIFITLLLGVVLFTTTACHKEKTPITEAEQFKQEYESLNGTQSKNGTNIYQTLEISTDNPFIYKEASDIIESIEAKETFVVYFGFAGCPWCRSIVPTLIDVASDLGIATVYYVDIQEIRDTIAIDSNGNITTTKEGTEDYYQLLEKLDTVLEAYTLTDSAGVEIDTGEKRIYAPTIIAVVKGEVKEATDGISPNQTDGFMALTEPMLEESYDKIKCTIQCVADSQAICSAKTKC